MTEKNHSAKNGKLVPINDHTPDEIIQEAYDLLTVTGSRRPVYGMLYRNGYESRSAAVDAVIEQFEKRGMSPSDDVADVVETKYKYLAGEKGMVNWTVGHVYGCSDDDTCAVVTFHGKMFSVVFGVWDHSVDSAVAAKNGLYVRPITISGSNFGRRSIVDLTKHAATIVETMWPDGFALEVTR